MDGEKEDEEGICKIMRGGKWRKSMEEKGRS